jgi:hypothetical protein
MAVNERSEPHLKKVGPLACLAIADQDPRSSHKARVAIRSIQRVSLLKQCTTLAFSLDGDLLPLRPSGSKELKRASWRAPPKERRPIVERL